MYLTISQLPLHLFLSQEREIVTLYFTYICSSTARDIFLGVLYGYKMVLQVIALVLAFATRKVKVKGLDDSKYIAAAIYVTSIVLAVIIVATYSLRDFVNGFATLFCTGFLIGTTVILGLVFVPKVRTLLGQVVILVIVKWHNLGGIILALYPGPFEKSDFSNGPGYEANITYTCSRCPLRSHFEE